MQPGAEPHDLSLARKMAKVECETFSLSLARAQYVGVMDTVCGRPTFEMIEGFVREGKIAWVWDTRTDEYHRGKGTARLPGEDYKAWGRIVVRDEGSEE